MLKKALLFLLVSIVLLTGAYVFTPLPYLPINLYLKTSEDVSGRVGGSLNSGITIKDFKIKAKPEGEILIKEIAFSYSGLFDYFVRDQLLIRDLKWEGVTVRLPQGRCDNWKDIAQHLADKSFLIPDLRNNNLKLVQIDRLFFRDFDVVMGKPHFTAMNGIPSPTIPLSPALLPLLKPTIPDPDGGPKTIPALKLGIAEMTNSRFEYHTSTRASVIHRLSMEGFELEKETFKLGSFSLQSNSTDLFVEKSGGLGGDAHPVYGVRGAWKMEASPTLKKDIDIVGKFVWKKYLELGLCEGKIRLSVSEKQPGQPFPTMEVHVDDLDLQEYLRHAVPLTDIEYAFSSATMFSQKREPIFFNIGITRFAADKFPSLFQFALPSMPGRTEPAEVMAAQSVSIRNVGAKILVDHDRPGRHRLQLAMVPPRIDGRTLLAKVWFGKDFLKLSDEERKILQEQAVHFGLPASDFNPPPKKKAVKLKRPAARKKKR